MLIETSWQDERVEVDLEQGAFTVGGSAGDAVCVPGLGPQMVSLQLLAGRAAMSSRVSFSIGRHLYPPEAVRVLAVGEVVQLPRAVTLRVLGDEGASARRSAKETACVLAELVGNVTAPHATRAATLTCLTGLEAGRAFPLGLLETVIGRAEDAAVRVRDAAVSRRQARLIARDGGFVLETLGGPNAVFVNSARVPSAVTLCSGDVIELGQTLLRYDGPSSARVQKPVAPEPTASPSIGQVARRVSTGRPVAMRAVPAGRAAAPTLPERWQLLIIGFGAVVAVLGAALIAVVS